MIYLQDIPSKCRRPQFDPWVRKIQTREGNGHPLQYSCLENSTNRHYITTKGSIQNEEIAVVNNYAPNIGAPQYIRQTLTDVKGETDSNTIIVGD